MSLNLQRKRRVETSGFLGEFIDPLLGTTTLLLWLVKRWFDWTRKVMLVWVIDINITQLAT